MQYIHLTTHAIEPNTFCGIPTDIHDHPQQTFIEKEKETTNRKNII